MAKRKRTKRQTRLSNTKDLTHSNDTLVAKLRQIICILCRLSTILHRCINWFTSEGFYVKSTWVHGCFLVRFVLLDLRGKAIHRIKRSYTPYQEKLYTVSRKAIHRIKKSYTPYQEKLYTVSRKAIHRIKRRYF
jgi:hypothetical protein